MGLLDLPAPLLSWLDDLLGDLLGPAVRLALWAASGAAFSMLLYRELTPQRRIALIEKATLRVRRRLDQHEGDFVEAMPLILRMLRLSLERLRLVVGPALIGALPIVCLAVWANASYDVVMPKDAATLSALSASALPATYKAIIISHDDPSATQGSAKARVMALDRKGDVVEEVPIGARVSNIHKRAWWNFVIGNPGGYLPADGPVEAIHLDLPKAQYLPFGPSWLRGWEGLFFTVALLSSLVLKFALKIR